MLKCSLCDYGDAYILVKRRITVTGAGADAASRQADEKNKSVIFKNCAPFIKRTSKINNMETNNAVNILIVMPMYNSDIYFFRQGFLSQALTIHRTARKERGPFFSALPLPPAYEH